MAESSEQSMRRTNHTWTATEDQALIDCVLEIGLQWKGDNGFRPGFCRAIEKMMHANIPGCSVKAIPHITSRIKLLKMRYNAIFEMMAGLTGSGFGWDDKTKMIQLERKVYDEWVKTHPNAKGLYNKPFPYYDQLGPIFGKDVAKGTYAAGPPESSQQIDREEALVSDNESPYERYTDLLRDETPTPIYDQAMPDTVTQESDCAGHLTTATVKKGKKRGRSEDVLVVDIGDAVKELTQSHRNTNENIQQLVSCFKQPADGVGKGTIILDHLKKIDGLTVSQRVQFAMIIGRDSIMADIFMNGSDEDRHAVVASLFGN